jgi:uncharacterized membrane protein YraQ (UPF0718 family)
MPADFLSTFVLILLKAADTVERAGPYIAGGLVVATLLSRVFRNWRWAAVPSWLPRPLVTPLAAMIGVVSPLPTTGMMPLILQWQAEGLPARLALTFVLASSLLNPQLFILTLGTLGGRFALAQMMGVLLLSTGLGLALGKEGGGWQAGRDSRLLEGDRRPASSWTQLVRLAEHVVFYFLVGVIAGASLQVLVPQSGVLGPLAERGWLSSPVLGWLAVPFYTCGGSAVPLAGSLVQIGFSPGVLFTFLLVGPALRGTTLANLACLLSRRAQVTCLVILTLAGGLLGYVVDWLMM